MVGRKGKPAKLHVLQGTYRPDRHDGNLEVSEAEPIPPKELEGAGLEEWKRIVALLMELRILSELDLSVLTVYCEAYARYLWCSNEMKKGIIFKAPNTGMPLVSPIFYMAQRCVDVMSRCWSELGLSPAARTRIRGSAEAPKKADLKKGLSKFLA